jgi:ABC-type transport system involved in multi-copper enzyme maturation permease subunit
MQNLQTVNKTGIVSRATGIALVLIARLVAPLAARADVFTPELVFTGFAIVLLFLLLFLLLTLAIEVPIIVLSLRQAVTSPRRLVVWLIVINVCTFAGLAIVILSQSGYVTYLLGEAAVAIVEALLVWQVVKRLLKADAGSQVPSRFHVMGLVVLANLVSAAVGVILSFSGLLELANRLISQGTSLGGRR